MINGQTFLLKNVLEKVAPRPKIKRWLTAKLSTEKCLGEGCTKTKKLSDDLLPYFLSLKIVQRKIHGENFFTVKKYCGEKNLMVKIFSHWEKFHRENFRVKYFSRWKKTFTLGERTHGENFFTVKHKFRGEKSFRVKWKFTVKFFFKKIFHREIFFMVKKIHGEKLFHGEKKIHGEKSFTVKYFSRWKKFHGEINFTVKIFFTVKKNFTMKISGWNSFNGEKKFHPGRPSQSCSSADDRHSSVLV